MSWTQDFSIPSVEELLITLTKSSVRDLLERELANHGLAIVKTEKIFLDGSNLAGEKVLLSDGRIFEPKLVRSETADGNWGNDVYEWRLHDEPVQVEHVDLSEPYDDGLYGCGDSLICGDGDGC